MCFYQFDNYTILVRMYQSAIALSGGWQKDWCMNPVIILIVRSYIVSNANGKHGSNIAAITLSSSCTHCVTAMPPASSKRMCNLTALKRHRTHNADKHYIHQINRTSVCVLLCVLVWMIMIMVMVMIMMMLAESELMSIRHLVRIITTKHRRNRQHSIYWQTI